MKRFLAMALALVLVLTGFSVAVAEDYSALKTLAVNVGSDPDTIDPALNSSVDGATMIIHGFEGLMTLDANGTPIYGAAQSHTVSEDGKVYTFTLRDGLKWSDGTALVAGDFVYSWNRAVSPDTAADYEYMFDVIKGYEEKALDVVATDDKTLVVTLNVAVPYFLELCAFPTFSPVRKDLVDTYGDTWATKPETYIGNGPYKAVEWVPGSHILYVKNENYWNVEALGPEAIKFVLMDDDNAILNAFVSGELLFADTLPNDEIDAWKAKENTELNIRGQIGTYYVSFNVEKAPLDNPLVRQALILAVDRPFIAENIGKAGQIPAGAYVPVGLTDADPTKQFRDEGGNFYDPFAVEENIAKAKELLVEAGYPNGEGLPTFEYLYNTSSGHQAIGEALQSMWKEIGVNVTLANQDWGTFLNTRKNGEYQIARNGWLGDYNDPISFLDMWITGGGNNDAQWSNAEYDALIATVKGSADPAVRYPAMHQAEKVIFDEWMLCPIYYYVDLFLLSHKVQGFWSSPLGYKYFMFTTVTE